MLSRTVKNKKQISKAEFKNKKDKIFKIIKVLIILTTVTLSFLLYSRYVSNYGIEIREYSEIYDDLEKEYHGLKIVHITDIHYGNTTFKKEVKNLVKTINKLRPDILVFTGDLVDKNYKLSDNEEEYIVNSFNDINTTIGKYFVLGDEDNDLTSDMLKKSNFISLNNTSELIYKDTSTPIYINGIASTSNGEEDLDKAFEGDNKKFFTITIMHETNSIDDILDNYSTNIIMAGHSRNGQIRLPFIGGLLQSKNAKKYNDFYYHEKETDIYISGGIGNKDIPFRLFNRPSVNLYRLRAKTSS